MNVEEYIKQCKIMYARTQEDKELRKVYSDVHFLSLIQEAEQYERDIELGKKLFGV